LIRLSRVCTRCVYWLHGSFGCTGCGAVCLITRCLVLPYTFGSFTPRIYRHTRLAAISGWFPYRLAGWDYVYIWIPLQLPHATYRVGCRSPFICYCPTYSYATRYLYPSPLLDTCSLIQLLIYAAARIHVVWLLPLRLYTRFGWLDCGLVTFRLFCARIHPLRFTLPRCQHQRLRCTHTRGLLPRLPVDRLPACPTVCGWFVTRFGFITTFYVGSTTTTYLYGLLLHTLRLWFWRCFIYPTLHWLDILPVVPLVVTVTYSYTVYARLLLHVLRFAVPVPVPVPVHVRIPLVRTTVYTTRGSTGICTRLRLVDCTARSADCIHAPRFWLHVLCCTHFDCCRIHLFCYVRVRLVATLHTYTLPATHGCGSLPWFVLHLRFPLPGCCTHCTWIATGPLVIPLTAYFDFVTHTAAHITLRYIYPAVAFVVRTATRTVVPGCHLHRPRLYLRLVLLHHLHYSGCWLFTFWVGYLPYVWLRVTV